MSGSRGSGRTPTLVCVGFAIGGAGARFTTARRAPWRCHWLYRPPLPPGARKRQVALCSVDERAEPTAQGARHALRHLPNLLTLCRMIAVPILVGVMVGPGVPHRRALATGIFVAAALTDYFDGKLARALDLHSELGAFLDPVADKLMVCTVLVALTAEHGLLTCVPSAVIVCREIFISALREYMALRGHSATVAVGLQGKLKTMTQMVALIVLIAAPSGTALFRVGLWTLYVATFLTLTSGFGYVRAAWSVFFPASSGSGG